MINISIERAGILLSSQQAYPSVWSLLIPPPPTSQPAIWKSCLDLFWNDKLTSWLAFVRHCVMAAGPWEEPGPASSSSSSSSWETPYPAWSSVQPVHYFYLVICTMSTPYPSGYRYYLYTIPSWSFVHLIQLAICTTCTQCTAGHVCNFTTYPAGHVYTKSACHLYNMYTTVHPAGHLFTISNWSYAQHVYQSCSFVQIICITFTSYPTGSSVHCMSIRAVIFCPASKSYPVGPWVQFMWSSGGIVPALHMHNPAVRLSKICRVHI
jgi:hypothetical protein